MEGVWPRTSIQEIATIGFGDTKEFEKYKNNFRRIFFASLLFFDIFSLELNAFNYNVFLGIIKLTMDLKICNMKII